MSKCQIEAAGRETGLIDEACHRCSASRPPAKGSRQSGVNDAAPCPDAPPCAYAA